MKLVFPNYYKQFHCLADKCKNSCCSAGWEIDIDSKTLDLYKNTDGELGEKLKQNIILTPTPHFRLNNKGICPFFKSNKLCEIYLNMDESSLCSICTEHPRYYELFNHIKEGGIGLCCEEVARIILSQNEKFETFETETPDEDFDEYNPKLYTYLFKVRENIINYLENPTISFSSRLKDILWYSHTIQQNIDFNLLDEEEIFTIKSDSNSKLKSILEFYLTLEPNNPNWITELHNNINLYSEYELNITNFESSNPQIIHYLKNISIYFIWRYFLKGVFDEDILSKIKLMISSILILKYLFFCKWFNDKKITLENCIEITTKYSEEIEYSEENIYKLAKASYELDFFDTETLLSTI